MKHEKCKLGLEWSEYPCNFFPKANTGEERVAPIDSNVRSSLPGLGPETSQGRFGLINQFY